ncbi:MAG: hypothetical protein DYG89_05985 [Caldilinea sp. CFX5]|nr:hypothetical protein [Caldilinea sp. CFX5]
MCAANLGVCQFLSVILAGVATYILVYGLLYFLQSYQMQQKVGERLRSEGELFVRENRWHRLLRESEEQLAKTRLGELLKVSIKDADLEWSVLLLLAMAFGLLVVFMLALVLLLGLPFGPNLALSIIATTFTVWFFLTNRRDAYERALQAQTPDIGQLISNSLRAGQSLYFALIEVEEKLPRPANREFRQLRQQIDLGEPIDQALRNFMQRHPGEEMRILIVSLLVQRRAGGDLIATLSTIANALRARRRVRHEIDAITAEARQTSLIVIVLPITVLVALNRISPGMVTDFISTPPGLIFFILVYLIPQFIAFLIIRRIGDVKV